MTEVCCIWNIKAICVLFMLVTLFAYILFVLFGCQYQCSQLAGKTRPRNDLSSGTLNSHLLTFAYILLCEILIRYFSSVYCRCLSGVYFCTWCAVFLSLLFYRHMSVSFLLRIFVDSLRVAHCTADNDKRSVTVGIAVCRLMHMTMVLAKLQKMKTLM